jgi:hypothetical protein
MGTVTSVFVATPEIRLEIASAPKGFSPLPKLLGPLRQNASLLQLLALL